MAFKVSSTLSSSLLLRPAKVAQSTGPLANAARIAESLAKTKSEPCNLSTDP